MGIVVSAKDAAQSILGLVVRVVPGAPPFASSGAAQLEVLLGSVLNLLRLAEDSGK